MSAETEPHHKDASECTRDDEQSTDAPSEAAAALPIAELPVSSLDDETLKRVLEQSRIVIRPDGKVVIENLTADLLDVAHALDPDAPAPVCEVEPSES